MKKRFFYCFIFFLFGYSLLITHSSLSQVELADPDNPVYGFLKRMQLEGIIPGYNSSELPLSRNEIAGFLKTVKKNFNKITPVDRKLFEDYEAEFEYDMYHTTDKRYSLISKESFKNIFSNKKQKDLFRYTDSSFTFFSGITADLSQRGSSGDSVKDNSVLLAEAGLKFRGTFFSSVGYFLELSNGQPATGNDSDLAFASETDPMLKGNVNFLSRKNFSSFEGYLRYQTRSNWLSLTFGRTKLVQGKGFIDKLFLSDNAYPFDFGKIDLRYKKVSYSFTYGSIKGDSVIRPLSAKNIATHYLNVDFSNSFRAGFWEAVIISNQPFSFTYLNPVSFLTSADLSSGKEQTTENNALIGFDLEVVPVKNLSLQSTLLIDDLTFGTLFKTDSLNENKFGWQFGALWTNSLNMNISAEYTHLDPFVYSHRTNKSTYTNHSMSLGHGLPPNSDEIALKIDCDITNRLNLKFLFQHQRSGEGIILDSNGNIIANYGGNINFGLGDAYLRTNGFLDGIRVNRDIFTFDLIWQPVKQFYVEGKFQYRITDNISKELKFSDMFYFATIKADL